MADGRHVARVQVRASRRGRRSIPVRALLSLGLIVGFGAMGTMAFWTDQAVVTGGSITSGAMDMQFDTTGGVGLGTSYPKSSISWTGLTPGEQKAFNLVVKNVGSPTFTYTATVTKGATPTWTYVGAPITVRFFTGSAISDTTYPQEESCSGSAIGAAQAVDATNKDLISSAQTIAGNQSQSICMVVGLASSAVNENQNRTGQLSFTFAATQAVS